MPEFQAIRPAHLRVHALGAEAMQLHAAGELAAATELCAELMVCKDQLLRLLEGLQQAVLKKITSL